MVKVTGLLTERGALMRFYDATNGTDWTHSDGWGTDAAIGEWYGVDVGSNGRVFWLQLPENNLTGALPAEIGAFRSLELLDLSNNAIEGTIPPEIGVGFSRVICTLEVEVPE